MCALIDACVLSKVFNPEDSQHGPFRTIASWIVDGKGSIVYGGSKYMEELGKGKYGKLFQQLRTARRAYAVDDKAVDQRAEMLRRLVPDEDFDDPHILAIIGVSKCCILCTDDDRVRPYFRRKDLYPDGVKIPKVYTRSQGKQHCSNSAVVGSCPRRPQASRPGKKPKSRPKVNL